MVSKENFSRKKRMERSLYDFGLKTYGGTTLEGSLQDEFFVSVSVKKRDVLNDIFPNGVLMLTMLSTVKESTTR